MLLHDLLGISEDIYLVEENYLSQLDIEYTLSIMENIRSYLESQSLRVFRISSESKTLGILLFNPKNEDVPIDFWSVFMGSIAKEPHRTQFEELADSMFALNPPERDVEVSPEMLRDAVNEYYSLMLSSDDMCAACTIKSESYDSVFSQQRVKRVSDIFEYLSSKGFSLEGDMLDICCGNGMSTMGLYKLGLNPISVDIDRCAICQGVEHEVLDPKRALVMDATMLSEYFEPESFDSVVGFMLGQIYEFNRGIWENIMREATKVAKDGAWMLFTVRNKDEIEIVANALQESGVHGEIIDNTDAEGVYDHWLFVGRKGQ